ncbi:cyclic pyranopterin monophosphate synthase [Gemmobacter lanyuensis]|uniref:GTP 3',8-cyclase n=1 Tax=Gemmobacter lanyuensis TaxID=1054497 RepID=A0A918J447_9RHOB|nr:GTP 3',8-cyclase MoaA [Gemmobacter lanyuensis]GGW44368.1 cyclic pyranopterin monophosphate synthase [Gemmobacter lanyuensis]
MLNAPSDFRATAQPVCGPLMDGFCRSVRYLRVSVTDRCDFRCSYCMAERVQFLPRKDLLTLEELDRLCSAFIGLGVTKLRVTGGEPLVRRDIMGFFRAMSRHLETGALRELTLTTNGSQLARHAADLAACGVRRVNVSLDTLDASRFAALTRRGQIAPVLEGIRAAQAAGLRVKINTVALRGLTETELFPLVDWCTAEGHELTFIELMPMGEEGAEARIGQFLPLSDLRTRLAARFTLQPLAETTGGPARYVRLEESGQKIGFITPLSHNFCESCNRVRLTCTGELYPCLGQEGASDLRHVLRAPESGVPLEQAIRAAIAKKPRGHDFDYTRGIPKGVMSRGMNHTGG